MNARELLQQRLVNLHIAAPATDPRQVVSNLGALQAQDYAGGLWAIGLRARAASLEDVQRAFAERMIVRTWPLRGTLHVVAAADVHWLLDLLAAREIAASAKRHRDLDLDVATFRKAEKALSRALAGGRQLTRAGVREVLERAKISATGPRLYHCIWRLALEKVLCCGVPEGKQMTFTLLPEWVPEPRRRLARDEALAALALRYFSSHGPATQRDLERWAGINGADAKLGIAGAEAQLRRETHAGVTHWLAAASQLTAAAPATFLLPGFDEYVLGYQARGAFLDSVHADKIVPGGNGVFRPTIVHAGKVIGTWKASVSKREVALEPSGFLPLSAAARKGFTRAAEHYARFLGKTVCS